MQITEFFNTLSANMPTWLENEIIVMPNWHWIIIAAIIVTSQIIEKTAVYYTARIFIKKLDRDSTLNEKKVKKFKRAFGLMVNSAIWIITVKAFPFKENIDSVLHRGALIVFAVAVVLTAHTLVDVLSVFFERKAKESDNKFDDILVPLLRKSAKFFIVAIGGIYIGDSLTLDMKGIVAGLGIGGIAFALAAKDTISNIFGSITVLVDRPFRIGDWVQIGDGVQGIVEEVGLRSTRIRTFYDSLITVPNGQLTNISIDNYGQRNFRRFKTTVGVQYDTHPDTLEKFCEAIKEIIMKTENIRKDRFYVSFNNMGAYSLDIMLYVFFIVPDYPEELEERHKLLMSVLRKGNELGVEFAFPTQTIHVQGMKA
ncbi:MAG: mechanosensitive ion channel family protein [Bacteriovoracaceae bacterium]|nr:mechanosensitive ion channel family protein [Bacteriovoracaceae bacterium]